MASSERDLLNRLREWHDKTGGWDAEVWRDLEAHLAPAPAAPTGGHTHGPGCTDLDPRTNDCPIYSALLAAVEVVADFSEWGQVAQVCGECWQFCESSAMGDLRHRLHRIGMVEDDAEPCGGREDEEPADGPVGCNEYPEGSGG